MVTFELKEIRAQARKVVHYGMFGAEETPNAEVLKRDHFDSGSSEADWKRKEGREGRMTGLAGG